MLFKITNGSVSFGADVVLENIDFEIKDKEKVAIVGRNGAGKTTLLKCITGEVEMEEGTGDTSFSVTKSGNPVIGHLKQISFSDENTTLLDEVLTVFEPILKTEEKMNALLTKMQENPTEEVVNEYSKTCERFEFLGGYTYKKEYGVMLKKFGFTSDDLQKKISEFSGGQRTKIAFIKLLLSHPDILLLDEPTNHLDLNAIKWLENYIRNYKSAVVMVSHDRMFVEKTVDRVYEIEYGETRRYNGNYSDFERQKKENYQKQLKDHEYQREEINRLNRVIERFRYKATKAKMVQSKIKQIERMKIIDAPDRYDLKTFHANCQPAEVSVKQVLKVDGLSIGYDKSLATVNLELFRGNKLGVIGDNGIGKSTFLKTLMSEISALSGGFTYGLKVQIGYFNQQMAEYSSAKTVMEDFCDEFPKLNETEVRTTLGSFLFTGEDVFKKVDDLSGGERVRLALCKIFKRRPNLLILDEPTNHMDIVGKETLENMLCEYEGTAIFVSHDRYFINKVADKLLAFEDNGANFYSYGYDEYERLLEERENVEREVVEKPTAESVKKSFSTPLKDRAKKERRVKKLEELIANLDEQIANLNAELEKSEVYSDYKKVTEIQTKSQDLQSQLDGFTEEWLTLTEELEKN